MPDLRKELEAAYARLRAAIENKNFSEFAAAVEPAKERPNPPPEMFEEAAEFMKDAFPTLSAKAFLKIETRGAWAGYYLRTELDDADFTTLTLVKFHKIEGHWKVYGGLFSASFPRSTDPAAEPARIEKELRENPKFKL